MYVWTYHDQTILRNIICLWKPNMGLLFNFLSFDGSTHLQHSSHMIGDTQFALWLKFIQHWYKVGQCKPEIVWWWSFFLPSGNKRPFSRPSRMTAWLNAKARGDKTTANKKTKSMAKRTRSSFHTSSRLAQTMRTKGWRKGKSCLFYI